MEGFVGISFNYVSGGVVTWLPFKFYTHADTKCKEPQRAISYKTKKNWLSTKEIEREIELKNKGIKYCFFLADDHKWENSQFVFHWYAGITVKRHGNQREIEELNRKVIEGASVPQIRRFFSEKQNLIQVLV